MDKVNEDNNYENDNNIDEESTIQNELFKELNIMNISYNGLMLVFIGVIINIKFVLWSRIRILDSINNTNYAEQIGDMTEFPKLSNRLYLVSTVIFVVIIYDQYRTQASAEPWERDEQAINDAWCRYVSIILVLGGTLINYSLLNRSNT